MADMALYAVWVMAVLVVIIGKYYTTRTLTLMGVMLLTLEKDLGGVVGEHKFVKNNVEILMRNLAQTRKNIATSRDDTSNLKREYKELTGKEAREMEEARSKLTPRRSARKELSA